MPLQPGKYTIGPEDIEPHVDENTIGVAAVVGTTFTGHADDVVGINDFLVELKDKKGLDVPLHIDGASGAFVWPFLYPHSEWDFRLEQVRSINASGHKFGLVYPGIGWLIFREKSDLAEDLVFYENYLGKTDATFTLNFSTGSSMVLAQYYNFVRFGKAGYRRIMEIMQENAESLAKDIEGIGKFQIIGEGEETLPLVAFNLAEEHPYDEFDIAFQLAAERGWMLPAYTMPPNAQDVKMMRALVKLNLSRSLVDTLARRHRRGDRDAREEGAGERVGAQAGQDQRHPLSRLVRPRRRPLCVPSGRAIRFAAAPVDLSDGRNRTSIERRPKLMKQTRSLAARAGRWSATHRKTAIWGWLAFVVVAFAIGGAVGTKTLQQDQLGVGESGRADQTIEGAFPSSADEMVLIQSDTATATDPSFRAVVADVQRRLAAGALHPGFREPLRGGQQRPDLQRRALRPAPLPDRRRRHRGAGSRRAGACRRSAPRRRPTRASRSASSATPASTSRSTTSISDDFKQALVTSLPITLMILLIAFGALVAAGVPLLLALTAVHGDDRPDGPDQPHQRRWTARSTR